MDKNEFERIVAGAIDSLPDEFRNELDNLDVVVQDRPTRDQLADTRLGHGEMLLGLYEGVPQTRRSRHYGLVPPDKITIFQKSIENKCRYEDTDIADEVRKVILHEIAHHFGIGETRLREIEGERE